MFTIALRSKNTQCCVYIVELREMCLWAHSVYFFFPGTGKTSMIKELSNYCKRYIHYLILNETKSYNELFELFKQINYKETILVIEDIDCMTKIIKYRNIALKESNNINVKDKKIKKIENN